MGTGSSGSRDGSSRWVDNVIYPLMFPGPPPQCMEYRTVASLRLKGNTYHDRVYFVPSAEVKATQGTCRGSPISCPVMLVPALPAQEETLQNDAIPAIDSPLPYVVVYFHGNAESLEDSLTLIEAIHTFLNCTIIAVEFPGYGITKPHFDRTNPSDIDRWAEDVFLWTRDIGIPPDRVIPFGRSIGTGPAARMAEIMQTKYGVAVPGLILNAPYRSIKQMGREIAGAIGAAIAGNPWDIEAALKNLDSRNTHVLILHGQKDEIIPYAHGKFLFDEYGGSVSAHFPKARGHNDFQLEDFLCPMLEFFKKHLVVERQQDHTTPSEATKLIRVISTNAAQFQIVPPEYIVDATESSKRDIKKKSRRGICHATE